MAHEARAEAGGNPIRAGSIRDGGRGGGRRLASILVASTILGATGLHVPAIAYAQQQSAGQTVNFDIPSQPLSSAINAFIRATGWEVGFHSPDVVGKRSAAVGGPMAPAQALRALLAGTGLNARISGPSTAALVSTSGRAAAEHEAPAASDGAIVLDTIDVTGGGESSVYSPYETAAPTSHIAAENIERFRGSSPADIFRGTPGVMSGEARNGAGSIDPNIRGMQGMGRVATTVDGAENSLQIYQGYQGISNRTFVDPDFIAGVDINKGADAASFGNAGSIAIRTISADDIVKPGDTWGLRVKGGFGTNTSSPKAGSRAGYRLPDTPWNEFEPTASPDGMDRPGFLKPTSGSGSIVAAVKEENYDLLAGYAYRKQGNYHAGRHGPSANLLEMGPMRHCYSATICADPPDPNAWTNYFDNTGIANYRAGEEVLNTQLETQSWLFKGGLRLEGGHSLQFGYTGFRSEAGDRLASALTGKRGQAVQLEQTAGTTLDTGTFRYRWNPDDSDLVDFRSNLWISRLELRNPIRALTGETRERLAAYGLPADFRSGSDTVMWGGDAANTSRFFTDYGSVDLTYGLAYRSEDTKPTTYTPVAETFLDLRDAKRQEVAGYVKASYEPTDWLTLNGGLRYTHAWSEDRNDPYLERGFVYGAKFSQGGFSPSLGVTLEPLDGVQIYANHSNALRLPSIIESVSAFTMEVNPALKGERSSSWDVGANLRRDGLLAAGDSTMLKIGYFNWDVKDYISREYWRNPETGLEQMRIHNIDRARFSGIEISGRYEHGGFTADLSANYYLGVEFCRTAGACEDKSLYADYATNHVPPRYSIDLTLSQKLFDDRFTVGGRVSHVGPRAIGHGDETGRGAGAFIAMTDWRPYTLVDVFAEYKVNDNYTASFRVENLTDQYYVDPLGLVNQPGPGRTFYASLTGTFGGDQPLPRLSPPWSDDVKDRYIDWTGLYAGFHGGFAGGSIKGSTSPLVPGNDIANAIAASESADLSFDSPVFGVQGGFNRQFDNRLVVGLEGDFSKIWSQPSQAAVTQEAWIGSTADMAGVHAVTRHDIDWTASIRGRLGYAFDNRWLAYGTAGVAFLKETVNRDQYRFETDVYDGDRTELFFTEKLWATRTGFTVGGGAEYAINDRWSIKGDYTYSRFGRKDFRFENARAGTGRDYTTREQVGSWWYDPSQDPTFPQWLCQFDPTACAPQEIPVYDNVNHTGSSSVVNGRRASNALDFHSFKIGLNYRF